MTFFHFYLLGGLSLISVPILVHLVTRDKPKQLRFPAFRFLLQKYHTNRRKLRLHHLLLLLLRMLVIAAIVFALARPRLYSDRLSGLMGTGQPVVVAMLFDTSMSMEYERGELPRLEEARRRALELIEELPDGSKVTLLDSAERGGEFTTRDAIRDRLKATDLRPDNGPVSRLMAQAFKMLEEEDGRAEGLAEAPPRYLYVFSDRTRPGWDNADVKNLKAPEGIAMVFVDVGIEKPTDLAIENVTIDPPAVVPGGTVKVTALVRATGERVDRNITCQIDDNPQLQSRNVKLEEGARQNIVFEYKAASPREGGLAPGPHQVIVRVEGTDRLPFNNTRHGTFLVRPGRSVLTIVDALDPKDPLYWAGVLEFRGFNSTVKTALEAEKMKLSDFDLVCLYQLKDPAPLWANVQPYVERGGRLVIIPGGDEIDRASYNDKGSSLMPARLVKPTTAPTDAGLPWDWSLSNPAPLMAPFLRWWREEGDLEYRKKGGQPLVYAYWVTTPSDNASVISRASLDGKNDPPMLIERPFGQGRVLLFTTKMSGKEERILFPMRPEFKPWVSYWTNSFGFVLTDKVGRYLVGDSIAPAFNFISGETINIPLPRELSDKYLLRGPGLPPQGMPLSVPEPSPEDKNRERTLPISRAVQPGNYVVYSVRREKQEVLDAFSLDVRSDESLLTPRVPVEEIEELFGKGSVLTVEHGVTLKDAIARKPQPIELLPYLMLALLVFLAVENVLANRSREKQPATPAPPVPESVTEKVKRSWRAPLMVLLWTALGLGVGAALGFMRGSSGSVTASALVTGLVGLSHGLLTLARFPSRDGAILGGLLGSMVGVLFGWLILGGAFGAFGVMLGMLAGAGALAADGWALALVGDMTGKSR